MNRRTNFYSLLSKIIGIVTNVCATVVGEAATTVATPSFSLVVCLINRVA
jgi:hypothetical protein